MKLIEAKRLTPGDRIRYTCEGPDLGDLGTVADALVTGVNVRWDDGSEIGYAFVHGDYHFRNLEVVK